MTNISYKIEECLGIPLNNLKLLSSKNALCLVHTEWLKFIVNGSKIPLEYVEKYVPDTNTLNFFTTSNSVDPTLSWTVLTVHQWKKHDANVLRFIKAYEKSTSPVEISYAELIHYVTKSNYKNLWEQAWKKYHIVESSKKYYKEKYNDALKEIIKRLFKVNTYEREDGVYIHNHQSTDKIQIECNEGVQSNILHLFCAVETTEYFLLVCEHLPFSLKDCLMFSPFLLSSSTAHSLFIIYQLIQVTCSIHNSGLFLGPVSLSSIKLKENLWVQLLPETWKSLLEYSYNFDTPNSMIKHPLHKATVEKDMFQNKSTTEKKRDPINKIDTENYTKLPTLVQEWVNGVISNYEYIIALNKLTGRQRHNPHCHYIMPWIMDFSVSEGGWRDLSKTKFRLNKGDKQLDLIYQSASEASGATSSNNSASIPQDSAVSVPHHTSEVLSDITYYVYFARRMPKSFLCQNVRQKWVPAEYPATIERLQEWTPDECIPEFFSDPSIFYSIHPDLNDLGVPWWCESPEDFIYKHRNALEGHHVSERLHNWIDLVFGYKLTGAPAVKSKNVCLPLVDCHTNIQNHGMVQLFSHPHPHKLSKSLFIRSVAPKTFRNVISKSHDAKDSGDDDTSSESLGRTGFLKGFRAKSIITSTDVNRLEPRPENQIIVLPKEFNPLSRLSHVESLFTFKEWSGKETIKETVENILPHMCEISAHHCQVKDMVVLGCLIGEIAVSPYFKVFPQTQSLCERYQNILKMLRMHKQDIPKALRSAIQLLLQVSPSYEQVEDCFRSPFRYLPVSSAGLPLPSPHQLLLPQLRTIPFPCFFPFLFSFLSKLNEFSKEISFLTEKSFGNPVGKKEIEIIANKKVSYAADQLQRLLPTLNSEGMELIIPYLQEMFENQYTALLSTWQIFGLIARALGPQKTCKKFLKLLTKVFDTDKSSPKHLKLYHRSFLIQIIVGLGLHNFLLHFTTILIEAIGGCKDYSLKSGKFIEEESIFAKDEDGRKISEMNEHFMKDQTLGASKDEKLNMLEETSRLQPETFTEKDNARPNLDMKEDEVLDDNDMMSTEENITRTMKDGSIDSRAFYISSNNAELKKNTGPSESYSSSCDSIYSQSAPSLSYIEGLKISSANCSYKKSYVNAELTKITKNAALDLCPSEKFSEGFNVSDVSCDSMLWLAHRLGPVLSARYLTRNLLRMLTLCYDSTEKREIIHISPRSKETKMLSISCKWLKGDINAFKVLDCLSRIASLYGEQFIMIQYIKHITDLLHLCRKRIPATLESGLLGSMALLQHIIPYISDRTLMDHLQDIFIKDIIQCLLRLVSSLRLVYPGSGQTRALVTLRTLDVMYIIGLRIGFEMTRKHLSGSLQKLFSCFDKVYNEACEYKQLSDNISTSGNCQFKEQALAELRQTFTPEMAFLAYIPFCKLAGGIFMEEILRNNELIRSLCLQHERNATYSQSKHSSSVNSDNASASSHLSHNRNPSLGQDESFVSGIFGKNVNLVGNRLDVHLGEDSHLVMAISEPISTSNVDPSAIATNIPKYELSLIKRKMDNCRRHLKGNWLAYWEHESGRNEKDYHFDFKQIKLQTFSGHTGAVRAIEVLDNENSFLTSSKDKTIKLWSLRSCGDGSLQIPCQWTYNQHRKSVFAVSFLNSLRLVGSCDTTVHIWDPFLGSCIKQIEPIKGSPVTVLEAMPPPSMTFLAATTNSTIRFLDARTCKYMHEFKVNVGTTGLIRSLAVSPNGNWLAVGHSTGMLSVLDVRTGMVMGTWLGHEGEVLQLKAFNNSYFVSSSLDHSLTVWEFEDTQVKNNLKGTMEPVTSICFYRNGVITGTTGNRIGQHSSIDKTASYISNRLRSDTFKGVLTTMALLPLNRLLLLGADNGNVVLLC